MRTQESLAYPQPERRIPDLLAILGTRNGARRRNRPTEPGGELATRPEHLLRLISGRMEIVGRDECEHERAEMVILRARRTVECLF